LFVKYEALTKDYIQKIEESYSQRSNLVMENVPQPEIKEVYTGPTEDQLNEIQKKAFEDAKEIILRKLEGLEICEKTDEETYTPIGKTIEEYIDSEQ
jgi:hypothetical protein